MQLSIFVSNLHISATKQCVQRLFSVYGKIALCKMYRDQNGNCRGFANITFKTEVAYKSALNAHIFFKSKQLRVEPYLSNKKELRAKDAELERLRICVLNIPKYFENSDFENVFRNHFGEITSAYIKENPSRDTNLGFVTFS
jgi:RNA recognition motif-containing protein